MSLGCDKFCAAALDIMTEGQHLQFQLGIVLDAAGRLTSNAVQDRAKGFNSTVTVTMRADAVAVKRFASMTDSGGN
eukprot:3336774-Alexandrium_andersonii.AAC.1